MDIQTYIESGILEAYVLGVLSPSERADVELHIATYPEAAAELAAIEEAMLSYVELYAEEPPAMIREQIWSAMSPEVTLGKTIATPTETKTIPLSPEIRRRQYSWANAAMLAVLVGSLAVNIMLWSQRNSANQQVAAMQQHLDGVQQQQAEMVRELAITAQQKEMMADTAMQTITMKSVVPGHPMAATVYWNKDKGEAYLAMQKLPIPEKGKQYQLWVIKDGKPVSMGVLPMELAAGLEVAKIPMEVKEGEAFAISLENLGGNPTPTEVYVLGKV